MVVNYKCPHCGCAMEYDGERACLHCDSCNSEIGIDEYPSPPGQEAAPADPGIIPKAPLEEAFYEPPLGEDQYFPCEETGGGNTIQLQLYRCASCGAELVTDAHTAAAVCSFCGSPGLITDRLTGVSQPAAALPFRLTKEQAVENLLQWIKKSTFTPREFLSQGALEKAVGMYVPYWLYDFRVNAAIRAKATRVRKIRENDTEYTYTDHYSLYREMDTEFEKVPADASERMDDEVMECLEPYDYSELKPFDMAYLSGYQAEKFNVSNHDLKERVRKRVRKTALDQIRSALDKKSYKSFKITEERVQIWEKQIVYAMAPVWVLHYRYKNRNYTFTINGQTGKRKGKLPWSKLRILKQFLILFCSAFAAMSVIGILGGLLA